MANVKLFPFWKQLDYPLNVTNEFSKAVRSRIMAAIRGKNTKPELKVRSALHTAGFRFRLHGKHLPGKPDIH